MLICCPTHSACGHSLPYVHTSRLGTRVPSLTLYHIHFEHSSGLCCFRCVREEHLYKGKAEERVCAETKVRLWTDDGWEDLRKVLGRVRGDGDDLFLFFFFIPYIQLTLIEVLMHLYTYCLSVLYSSNRLFMQWFPSIQCLRVSVQLYFIETERYTMKCQTLQKTMFESGPLAEYRRRQRHLFP